MRAAEQLTRDVVLAILREAHEAGLGGLTRTSLVKYVYLLDVFCAEEHQGQTRCTSLEWVFLHYGPYSIELAASLDELEARSFLEKDERTSNDKEFFLYKLSNRAKPRSLKELDLPPSVASRLGQAMRDFAYSLPKLLDYVYFKTAPMTHARPKEVLTFDTCRKISYRQDVKPLKLAAPTVQQAQRMRELIGAIKKRHRQADGSTALAGIVFDSYYLAAINQGDSDSSVDSGELVAALEFPSREENESE